MQKSECWRAAEIYKPTAKININKITIKLFSAIPILYNGEYTDLII